MHFSSRPIKALILLSILMVAGAILFLSFSAFSASNTVSPSRVGLATSTVDENELKPDGCSGINLTNIVYCDGGNCNGTNANDLILGSDVYDNIKGKKGTDCVVGGGGDDDIAGGSGQDVCYGGPGWDTFNNCMYTYQ